MSMLGHDTMSASGHRPIESVTLYAVLLEPEVQNLIDPEARKEARSRSTLPVTGFFRALTYRPPGQNHP